MDQLIEEIKHITQFCWNKGWSESNAGNFSINISNLKNLKISELNKIPYKVSKCNYPFLHNQNILVSVANAKFRDIAIYPERFICILKITPSGNIELFSLIKNPYQNIPTSELETHLAIHNAQIELGNKNVSVLHTHPTALVALSCLVNASNKEKVTSLLSKYYPESLSYLPEGIGFISYTSSGSKELAIKTAENTKKHRLIIWEKHGCISFANSLNQAYDLIDIAEKSAMIYLWVK